MEDTLNEANFQTVDDQVEKVDLNFFDQKW